MRFPDILSRKNVYRKYKLELYKGEEEGKIIFFETIKKEFFSQVFAQALNKLKFAKEDLPEGYKIRATRADLSSQFGVNEFIDKRMQEYINQIKKEWRKKNPGWELWKHEFARIDFMEKQDQTYDVEFELKIWVARP